MSPFSADLRRLFAEGDVLNRETDELLARLERQKRSKPLVTKRVATKDVVHKTVSSAKTRGLEFILSTADPDRYDDIIIQSGWELSNFRKNPVALFSHRSDFPIGSWKNVRVEDNALRGELVLAPKESSDRISEIHSLVSSDILRSVSVGFQPLEYQERKGDTYGIIYERNELIEVSLVAIPANPSAALIQAKRLGVSVETQEMIFGAQAVSKYYTSKQINALIEQLLDALAQQMGKALSDDRESIRQEIRREILDLRKDIEISDLRKEITTLKRKGTR